MEWTEFLVTQNDDGRRLDTVLRRISRQQQLSGIFAAVRKNLVRINGKPAKPGTRIHNGDSLQIASFLLDGNDVIPADQPEPQQSETELPPAKIPIIFQNEKIIAVAKPAGMLAHGGPQSLTGRLLPYLLSQSEKALSFRPGPLHRLDRNTSGVMCFSTSLQGAQKFTQSLQAGMLEKYYFAIVEGEFASQEAEIWQDSLNRQGRKTRSTSGQENHSERKNESNAQSIMLPIGPVEVRGTKLSASIIAIRLITGRTHQIRAQAAARSHPIVGDRKYGSQTVLKGQGLLLHALALRIPAECGLHNEDLTIQAPLPRRWSKMLILPGNNSQERLAWQQSILNSITKTLQDGKTPAN